MGLRRCLPREGGAKSIEQKVVEGIFELSEFCFCQIFQAGIAGLGVLKRTILFGLRELDLTTK